MCDLALSFELSGPTFSHHLYVQRDGSLIKGERRGTWVYYKVIGDKTSALARLLVTAEAIVRSKGRKLSTGRDKAVG